MKKGISKTTLLSITNSVLLVGSFIVFALGYINGEQLSAVLIGGSSIITSAIGYFSKDDENKKPIDLSDPELVAKLQSQAEAIKRVANQIRDKNKEHVD